MYSSGELDRVKSYGGNLRSRRLLLLLKIEAEMMTTPRGVKIEHLYATTAEIYNAVQQR